MCILCVIQKWSRRVATMLPWLVIPLIGMWLLSQLFPPAFRCEITSPRLACVFVLLLTLCWYEVLMPQLSSWRIKRNARAREKKLLEAIEMQKLKKAATRRCRNCLNPYRDQNPGGGKFMCSYCGHISKRPVLDLPGPPSMGLSNSGILKYLVEKCGKVFSGKVWFDNGWMCGQYCWLEDSNCIGGSLNGKLSYRRNGAGLLRTSDPCLGEKSCSHVLNFAFRAFATFFLIIGWLCRKVFGVSSSRDDASSDAERRSMLNQRGDTGGNCHESRGEKARRKAEEKRHARLVKEQLEEEERKQREEVAKLVEERRRLRDEKMEAEKEHRKGSSPLKEIESKKGTEKKRQERKKERDRGSSKSNSDVEELEKRGNKENERCTRSEGDRHDHHKTGLESVKAHGAEVGHTFKGTPLSNTRGNAGTRYFDRVRGTFLSSSRAFSRGGFFGKSSVSTVSREQKSNAFVDHMQATTNRREVLHSDRSVGKSNAKGDDKKISRPVLIESQPSSTPKKSWQQLFTRSSSSTPCSSNVISRPNGNSKSETLSLPLASNPPSTQAFDNPINFGFSSPFTLPSVSFGTTNTSTSYPFSNNGMFTRTGEALTQYLPEESEDFEDPCYVPDPASLLGPVSESLDNFQLDLGFAADSGLETPCASKNNISPPAELPRPSPIESPLTRLRVSEEGHGSSFSFPSTPPKAQDLRHLPVNGSPTLSEAGTWQMWNTSPLGEDGLSLVVGPANRRLPPELNRPKNEDILHPVPQRTMASLFKKDGQVLSGTHSPQKVFVGSVQNGGSLNNFVSGASDGSWSPNPLFRPNSGSEDQFTMKPKDEAVQGNLNYGSSRGSVPTHQTDVGQEGMEFARGGIRRWNDISGKAPYW